MEKESRLLRTFIRGTEDQKGLHTDKECANEHDLIRFNTPKIGYYCNLCGEQDILKDTFMYGCNECDTSCESVKKKEQKNKF